MSTNINFNKKLAITGGAEIILPSSSTPEFSDVNSFLFDGIDEKMFSTANYTELNGSTNFSISFWIKPIGNNSNGVWEIETQGNNETLTCRYLGSQQLIIIHFRSQSYYYRSAPNSVLLNQWSHIVYTYNGALGRYDRPEIYVNGALSQGVNSGVPYTSSNFNGTLTFGDATQYVYGNNYIDEFAVWNDTTLTQTQANELYNGGAPSDLNNIASGLAQPTTWLRMGENSVWNGFTWTMTDVNGGAVLRAANMQESSRTTDVPPNPFANTKSILLDGVDDSITLPNITIDNNSFTFSMWIKPINAIANDMLIQKQSTPRNAMFGLQSVSGSFCALVSYQNNSSSIKVQSNNIAKADILNNWSHVVIVRNGLDSNFYLNGANIGGGTFASLQPSTIDIDKIGFGFNNWYFQGNIDEVAIWNSQLSQSDITSIYNLGVPNNLNDLSNPPLSWWRCGDGDTAPTLTDNGSGGNDGTMTNFSAFSSDVPTFSKKSIALDGVDDYVQVADADNLSFGDGTTDSPFSISAWIKIGQTTAQGIVTKYGSNSSTREYLFYTTGGKLRLLFIDSSNGANNFATGTTNLSIDTWYHVACTYDGRGGSTAYNGMTLYINGVAETVTTIGGSYTAMSNTTEVVQIGKYSTNELLGNIDEVSVFNSELSQSDITSIYGGGVPSSLSSYSSLVSWWRCGDNDTAPILTDNAGSNDGTMVNFTTFSTDVPT